MFGNLNITQTNGDRSMWNFNIIKLPQDNIIFMRRKGDVKCVGSTQKAQDVSMQFATLLNP